MSIKAKKVQFKIGDISMNGYLLPDGRKRLSGRNVTDSINEHDSTLTRFYGVKSLKDLPGAGSECRINPGKEGSPFLSVSIEDAVVYWQAMAERGNKRASALMIALAHESIERRIDAALGIHVDEVERNRQLAERIARLEARHQWTDVIKDYQVRMGYYATDKARVMNEYKQLTGKVNLALFGCWHFKCDRDNMTLDQQQTIKLFEGMLRRRSIQYPDRNPDQLVDSTLTMFLN